MPGFALPSALVCLLATCIRLVAAQEQAVSCLLNGTDAASCRLLVRS